MTQVKKTSFYIPPEKIYEILHRLEKAYGKFQLDRKLEPIDELICCILSQHTSDANSFPAFYRLKETFPNWDLAVEAGQEAIANVVRSAGLANQKSKSIINCLKMIKSELGHYDLNFLGEYSLLEARKWLMRLPGVGPKTASIVLCFSLGKPAIPVDTHVFRVAHRLGLLPQKTNADKAHDILLENVPEEIAFDFHMALIEHGRRTCKAPRPLCEICVLTDICPWYAEYRAPKLKKSR